jgi:hypothetical protein
MDLRFFVRAVFPTAAFLTRCLAATSLFCAVSLQASAGRDAPDYLYPEETLGGVIESDSRLQAGTASSRPKARISYRAFDGQSYAMQEYRGRHVAVLLPDNTGDSPPFTAEHLEEMVDRLDELYALYRDILQAEPDGSGLLKVAFVPETCGAGCGLLGAKGIEIRTDALNYAAIIEELDAGRLDSILVHEMAHNFDIFLNYLHYLPNHAHAWTDFFEYFAAYRYGRHNLGGEAPDDVYQSPVSQTWKDYVASESANWSRCVRDGACGDLGLSANNAWAMPYYRMEELYGSEAMVRSFRFLSDYVKQNPAPRDSEAKEGLRILSLGHGAGANIACHMESLNWLLPGDVKSELQNRFGGSDPMCADRDRDGFTAVTGDCDESDPARHLLGEETEGNRRDDDCDRLTDEKSLVESSAGQSADNFRNPVDVSLPFEVSGNMATADDSDRFRFAPGDSGRVHATLCAAAGFKGWATALDDQGAFLGSGTWYTYRAEPGCSSATFDFGELTGASIIVMADGARGDYSLTVRAASEMPNDHSALLAAIPRTNGGVRLEASDPWDQLQGLGADELEVWVSGTDLRLSVPYPSGSVIALSRSSAPQLDDGALYQARVRPKADGQPLAAFSAGHLFRYQAGPVSAPRVDHRYSGAWFDPAHEGEGFLVEVLEGERAVVYWFTYQADGRQRWMLGVGSVDGNRIVFEQMLDSHGGRFGNDFVPGDVVLQDTGSLTISFQDCGNAIANYTIDGSGGSQVLTRLTDVHGHRCGNPDVATGLDLTGSWYDPSHNGEGFVVEQLGPDQAVVFWFTYDDQGEQAWLFNTGTIDGSRITFPDLLQPQGGLFGRSYDPATVRLEQWGTLELDLDCDGGPAAYQSTADGFSGGSQELVNLTRLQNSGCGGL